MTRLEKQEYWRELIALWERSDKSQKEFCEDQQVVAATFSYWKKRLAQPDREDNVEFFPLAVSKKAEQDKKAAAGITLAVQGGRFSLDVAEGFSEDILLKVLRVLEAV